MHVIAFDGFLSAIWGDYYYFNGFLSVKWGDYYYFNGFLSVKWGDNYYYMPNGAIHYSVADGAIKTIMPIGVISGSWSICILCICINIESWVLYLLLPVYFRVMNVLN